MYYIVHSFVNVFIICLLISQTAGAKPEAIDNIAVFRLMSTQTTVFVYIPHCINGDTYIKTQQTNQDDYFRPVCYNSFGQIKI